jgi:hypothetical protein
MAIEVGTIRRRYKEPTFYIGRGIVWRAATLQASPLANPFKIAQHGRKCQALYKRWLWDKIQANDELVMEELRLIASMDNVVLQCWCVGTANEDICHGHVVKAAVEWLKTR